MLLKEDFKVILVQELDLKTENILTECNQTCINNYSNILFKYFSSTSDLVIHQLWRSSVN